MRKVKVRILLAHMDIKDPFNDMQEGYIALHEMFINLISAGFTERQACVIAANIFFLVTSNAVQQQPPND